MKIEYQRFDFAKGAVEERQREIDSNKVLAANALFQRLSASTRVTPARLNGKPE